MFKNAHTEIMRNHIEGFQNNQVPKRIYRTHLPYYPPDFDRFWISKRIHQKIHLKIPILTEIPQAEITLLGTCPTFGNEKSSTQKWFGNVIFPRRAVFFLAFVENFFCRRSTPPGMAVLIAIMKQGNEVAIPPEAGNLRFISCPPKSNHTKHGA